MTVTMDKAGRIVIPAPVRERLQLAPGTVLKLEVADYSLRLHRDVPGPELVRAGERWIARPRVPAAELPAVDFPALIEEERDRWPL